MFLCNLRKFDNINICLYNIYVSQTLPLNLILTNQRTVTKAYSPIFLKERKKKHEKNTHNYTRKGNRPIYK